MLMPDVPGKIDATDRTFVMELTDELPRAVARPVVHIHHATVGRHLAFIHQTAEQGGQTTVRLAKYLFLIVAGDYYV
jgi:hypothetical protein